MRIGNLNCFLICGAFISMICSVCTAGEMFDFQITEVKIPMGDGGALAADVYLPGDGKYPTILSITKASKRKSRDTNLPRTSFFRSGDYAIVCVERRRRSGATSNSLRSGINPDGHDGYDVVEWIAKQPWSDGKVGMWGASNVGKIQYATAMAQPPHLLCIMPAETRPVTREQGYMEVTYDQVFPGGILRLEMLQNTVNSQKRKSGRADGGPASKIAAHALDDGFFAQRPEGAPTLKDVNIPIMALGSWFDNDINRATIDLFHQILLETPEKWRPHHRLFIGPWTHTGVYSDGSQGQFEFDNAAEAYMKREQQFYDYYLRDIDNGYDKTPLITYYQMGANKWHTTNVWPPAGSQALTLYLQPDGKMSKETPSANAMPDVFISNPDNPTPTVGGQNKMSDFGKGPYDQTQKVESHPDVLIYTSAILTRDITVVGDVGMKLFIASDSEDTDLMFRLTDVFPADGSHTNKRSMLLRDSAVRMSLRNSRKAYDFLTPGKVYKVTIDTIPVAYTFMKGHQIRVIISSSNYPRYDVNTNTRDKSGVAKAATNRLSHDADHPSALQLMVMP